MQMQPIEPPSHLREMYILPNMASHQGIRPQSHAHHADASRPANRCTRLLQIPNFAVQRPKLICTTLPEVPPSIINANVSGKFWWLCANHIYGL